MSTYNTLRLRRGKTESLKRFHPWIFSGAIERLPSNIKEGEIVRVCDHEGNYVATGHYQRGSIAVRILSFKDIEINHEFWQQRLREAWFIRQSLGLYNPPLNDVCRLIHGEGDCLPGLIIDIFSETAVVQAHSIGMHLSRAEIAKALTEVCPVVKHVFYKSEATMPFSGDDAPHDDFLIGGTSHNLATENGLKFQIDWLKGQKTGFFVDQRENRSLIEKLSKGRNVLNMFCYTGGFSVYALRGGANLVHSVDSSAKAIDLAQRNVELNFPEESSPNTAGHRHTAYAEDAFRFLHHSPADYDLIVLDPPAFAKHRGALHNAIKGYTRLNALAFEKIKPGGIIFTFSCSQAVSNQQFRLAVFSAAARVGRHVRILHQLHQPADHPINIYHPEGEYLKGLVLYVE